ncbi:MAG TPA: hypothetical protein VFZ65_06035 [Planctomycetota bacterium]|nr:hypothetical protein [Planctomycetota bacterium]
MHHHLAAFSFAVCITAAGLAAQGEVDSRSTARKGASVWLINELTTDATVDIQGSEMSASTTTSRTLHLQVADVDAEGNYLVEIEIVRVHGTYVAPDRQIDIAFDSADGSVPTGMKKDLLAGAGMRFEAKVSPAGRLLELGEGTDALLTTTRGARANMHAPTRAGLVQIVTGAFGILPAKKTAGGAQWQLDCLRVVGMTPVLARVRATLSKVDLDTFEIDGTGTVDLDMDRIVELHGSSGAEAAETARQVRNTKVNSGKIVRKQVTSRADGFVESASETVELDVEVEEPTTGAMASHIKMANRWRRTTEANALPKQ